MNRPLVYLACPYTHKDPKVREYRFHMANKAAAWLTINKKIPFSPITHSHPISAVTDLPTTWEFWEGHDRAYLSCSNELCVLTLPGWEKSKGVQAELVIAKEMGIKITYLSPDTVQDEV
jgi:hypothetical protein